MDLKLFQLINRISGRCSPIDQIMVFISNRIRFAYLLIIVYFLFKNRFNKMIAVNIFSSIFISLVTHFFIKLFFKRPRPFMKRHVGILIPSKMDSSFPSKHTILAFAASSSIMMFQRKLGTRMMWMSALTGFSRVWVGHHYPSDIMGSAILGSLAGVVTRIIFFRKSTDKPDGV
jgi:undecaprenyl-diphosphatase